MQTISHYELAILFSFRSASFRNEEFCLLGQQNWMLRSKAMRAAYLEGGIRD